MVNILRDFMRRAERALDALVKARLLDARERRRALENAAVAISTPPHFLERGILDADLVSRQNLQRMAGATPERLLFKYFDTRQVETHVVYGKLGGILGMCFDREAIESCTDWLKSYLLAKRHYVALNRYGIDGPGPNGQPYGIVLGMLRRGPWAWSRWRPFFIFSHGDPGEATVTISKIGKIHVKAETFARMVCNNTHYREAILNAAKGQTSRQFYRPTVLVLCRSAAGDKSVVNALNLQLHYEKLPTIAYGTGAEVGITNYASHFGKDFPGLGFLFTDDLGGQYSAHDLNFLPKSHPKFDNVDVGSITIWPYDLSQTAQSTGPTAQNLQSAQKLLPPPRSTKRLAP